MSSIIAGARAYCLVGLGMLLLWVTVANPSSQDRTPRCAILSAVSPSRASGLLPISPRAERPVQASCSLDYPKQTDAAGDTAERIAQRGVLS